MTSGGFAPTHLVPTGGLPAYEQPNPSSAPIAQLDPNLEVSVADRLGDWARIVCSNGWAAWVDGRRLVANGTVPTAPAMPTDTTSTTPAAVAVTPALVGAGLAVAGMFIGWIRGVGMSGNAFDLPMSLLWSAPANVRPSGLDLWIPLAALLAVGVAGCVRGDDRLRRIGGLGLVVVAALYVVWLFRLTNEPLVDVGLLDVLGIGAPLVAGSGALLAFGKATR